MVLRTNHNTNKHNKFSVRLMANNNPKEFIHWKKKISTNRWHWYFMYFVHYRVKYGRVVVFLMVDHRTRWDPPEWIIVFGLLATAALQHCLTINSITTRGTSYRLCRAATRIDYSWKPATISHHSWRSHQLKGHSFLQSPFLLKSDGPLRPSSPPPSLWILFTSSSMFLNNNGIYNLSLKT